MKAIAPIVLIIIIVGVAAAAAGTYYVYTNVIMQQSRHTSFVINSVYCLNNTIYFDIYNNGSTQINVSDYQIIFTDNNGNVVLINGSSVVCDVGNMIPSGKNSLCHIIDKTCYYNSTAYIINTSFIYGGVIYNYVISDNNRFNFAYVSNFNNSSNVVYNESSTSSSSSNNLPYIPIVIYNVQSIPTQAPFQQQIAICNGSVNIVNSFSYINNATIFNQINPNGQNIMFTDSDGNILYSWYEGQLWYEGRMSRREVACYIWWIKLPNGIPANSSITIYMYVGPNNSNYYVQYYPYVGQAPHLSPTYGQYDNGEYVFLFYDNFAGIIFDMSKWRASLYGATITVNNGLTIDSPTFESWAGLFTLSDFPPDTIFEAYLASYTGGYHVLHGIGVYINNTPYERDGFGYLPAGYIGDNKGGYTVGSLKYPSLYIYYEYPEPNLITSVYWDYANNRGMGLNYKFSIGSQSRIKKYNYYVIGAYSYSCLTCLDRMTSTWYWARVRFMPPNGVMPRIYINLSTSLSNKLVDQQRPNKLTDLPNSNKYSVRIYNNQSIPTQAPFQQQIAICNGSVNIVNSFSYINNATIFNQINPNGQNIMFTDSDGNILYSWYEGQLWYEGRMSRREVACYIWWIKLPNGIPANSSITIYMYVGPNNSNYYVQYYPYVGQAPHLSPTYGQYDNGEYVFLFYDNFAGIIFDMSKWRASLYGATITVNNGLTIDSPTFESWAGLFTLSDFPPDTIFEAYLASYTGGYHVLHGIGVYINNTPYERDGFGYLPAGYIGDNKGGYTVGSLKYPSLYIYYEYPEPNLITSVYWDYANNRGMGLNYKFSIGSQSRIKKYNYYVIGAYSYSCLTCLDRMTSTWYWARVRFMPPNGVMPRIYID
jgi:hypothetical protein